LKSLNSSNMNHITRYIPILCLPFLASCSGMTQAERNRQKAEAQGSSLLEDARKALRAEDYSSARRHIMSLRHDIPLALDARRRAILVLDSIELAASRDSVQFAEGEEWERLSMKVQFYERKLKEDIKHYGE